MNLLCFSGKVNEVFIGVQIPLAKYSNFIQHTNISTNKLF